MFFWSKTGHKKWPGHVEVRNHVARTISSENSEEDHANDLLELVRLVNISVEG